jgi:hypothetical protein
MKKFALVLFALALTLAISPNAMASPITVNNPSFEIGLPAGSWYNYGPVPSWTFWNATGGLYDPYYATNGGPANGNGPNNPNPGTLPNLPGGGITVAWLAAGDLYQQIGTVSDTQGEYVMNVYLGQRSDQPLSGGFAELQINVPNGPVLDWKATPDAGCTLSSYLGTGGWCEYTATLSEAQAASYVGDPLYIVLGTTGGGQGIFDLVSASVPEGGSDLSFLLLVAAVTLAAMRLSKAGMAV